LTTNDYKIESKAKSELQFMVVIDPNEEEVLTKDLREHLELPKCVNFVYK